MKANYNWHPGMWDIIPGVRIIFNREYWKPQPLRDIGIHFNFLNFHAWVSITVRKSN